MKILHLVLTVMSLVSLAFLSSPTHAAISVDGQGNGKSNKFQMASPKPKPSSKTIKKVAPPKSSISIQR
jgi:hypothetical protein